MSSLEKAISKVWTLKKSSPSDVQQLSIGLCEGRHFRCDFYCGKVGGWQYFEEEKSEQVSNG